MTRSCLRRILHGAIAALLLLIIAPSAHAAPTDWLEFSVDGTSWSRTPPSAVFTEGIVLVPGDAVGERLHLRSAAESTGILTISIANVTAAPAEAAEAFDLGIMSDRGEGFGRTALDAISGADAPMASYALEPGESVALTLTVGLDAAVTGSKAQNSELALDIEVAFIDARAVSGGGAPPSPRPAQTIPLLPPSPSPVATERAPEEVSEDDRADPSTSEEAHVRGPLAATGISGGALLLTAAMMIAAGVLALAVRRRRERQ